MAGKSIHDKIACVIIGNWSDPKIPTAEVSDEATAVECNLIIAPALRKQILLLRQMKS